MSLVRDAIGRVTEKTETVLGATEVTAYGYDDAGRLTAVTRDDVVTSYAYDLNGNRLSRTDEDGVLEATYDAQDRLLSYGSIDFAHDAAGDRVASVGDPAAVPPTDVDAGGAEFLATHLAALRKDNPNTVTVAAGDCIGATPLPSAAFHDEPTLESLDALGLDVAAVGNHEFDEGVEELWRMQYGGAHPDAPDEELGWDGDGFEGARYSYLAANVIYDEDGETVFPVFTVRRFGHAWVAFIGMTLEGTPDVVTAEGVEGLTFLERGRDRQPPRPRDPGARRRDDRRARPRGRRRDRPLQRVRRHLGVALRDRQGA
ncbi:MAG: hypothetical protein IT385_24860 [Deltaproteobacteria bacterium]|nr:hypothetical protein [Deltaproteobacteria bacterium]